METDKKSESKRGSKRVSFAREQAGGLPLETQGNGTEKYVHALDKMLFLCSYTWLPFGGVGLVLGVLSSVVQLLSIG